ncbi:MAG: SDR family NAD(P)-dependent oxidoreductase [Candidatus Dormibacteria bacterium]
MSDAFEGRTCVVTGAGSGIGQALCSKLRDAGARVFGADLDPSGVPDGCVSHRVDVTSEAEVAAMVAAAVDAFGSLDVLCNNAGIGSTHSVVDTSVEEWEQVFAVNVRGVFLGCKHGLRRMLDQGGGVIVNTASIAGLVGLRDRAAYCASKGAVVSLTKQVALQYSDRGIRCNCVCPGTVDSPWVGRLLEEAGDPEAARAALVARQPMGRLGTPEEIASAIYYLASDAAAFMTGSALVIDGGLLAG